MSWMRRLSTLVGYLGLIAGCHSSGEQAAQKKLTVFAASSLSEAFRDLERSFEAQHPNTDVQLTLAGSQVLRLQLEQGATADVFASANETHLQALEKSGVVREGQTFAKNQLELIVPRSNPADLHTFSDLPKARRLVVGTDNVPVGTYARRLFERAAKRFGRSFSEKLRGHIVSEESNVRLVRAKVELGEADAAIVYHTDATSSNKIHAVGIPPELNVAVSYPISLVSDSHNPSMARRFIEFVLSESGQELLQDHGFKTEAR